MSERTTWGQISELKYGRALRDYEREAGSGPVVVFGTNGAIGFTDRAQVKRGGVIVGRKGAYRGVHYSPDPFWVIDTAFYLEPTVPMNQRWAYYALQLADINGLDSGSAIPSTTREAFASIPVAFPKLREQQAIAEVLGALDDKIAANTRLAAKSDAVLSTLFESMVDEKTEFVSLSSIADVNAESIKPTGRGDLRYVDIASVGVGRFEFPEISAWADAPGRARRRLRRGDTIWSTVRPNRRSHALNLSDDPLLVASTGLAVLTPRFVSPSYLYEVTHRPDFTVYLENVAEGSAYPAVRADRFNDAPVPLLREEARHRFDDFAEPLRKAIATAEVENRTLAAIRDALLPQLMSGRLRVNDVKAFEEEAGL